MSRIQTVLLPSFNAAWRWWSGELVGLVPAPLRRRLSGKRDRFILYMSTAETAELLLQSGDRERTLARVSWAPDRIENLREAIRAARSRHPSADTAVTVRLAADAALRTTMTLPLAAQTNLAQVVSFELDRRTPFKSDEIYFTHRLVKRDVAAQRLVVDLTVVPRSAAGDVIALADRLNIDLEDLEVATPDGLTPPARNLLPARPQPLASRIPDFALAGLATLAVILACAVLAVPVYQSHRTADELASSLAEIKKQAEESLGLQKEIDAELQESGFLGTRKRQAVSVSETLEAVTHLLPDDTYLTELEISGGDVQLSGIAASASGLLGLLDQSQGFTDATFRSPVIQDQRTNREQFNISAKIARRKAQ